MCRWLRSCVRLVIRDSYAFCTLARIMHKFSTASPQSSVLTVLRDPQAGAPCLLSVPYSTLAGTSVARLVSPALSSLRSDEGDGAS